MNLGKTLQNLRKKKNISQEDMAEILNVSRQTISNWENSKSYPDILILIKLCDIYKISLDELLKEDKELLNSIKKNKKKKNNIIISCLIIIITLIILLSYTTYSNNFNNINNLNKEINIIINNKDKFIEITKDKKYNKDIMTDNYLKIYDNEYKEITSYLDKYNYKYYPVYRFTNYHKESTDIIGYKDYKDILEINYNENHTPFHFFPAILDIVKIDNFNKFYENNIIGNIPKNNNEILISNVIANEIINSGINTDNNYFYPKNYEDIINNDNYYYLNKNKIKISGIINYNLDEFKDIKNISWKDLNTHYNKYQKTYDLYNLKTRNIYNKIYVNKDFIANLINSDDNDIWKTHLTQTSILVVENNKNKLNKLYKKFNNEPYKIKSTYSEVFE